jgi:hypothetical protein
MNVQSESSAENGNPELLRRTVHIVPADAKRRKKLSGFHCGR